MTYVIKVKTPARLHLGLIDLNGNLGRLYGSVGVAVNRPNTVVEAKPSEDMEVSGLEKDRVSNILERLCRLHKIRKPCIRVNVLESIPRHCGLGSGTQLSLALASAFNILHGIEADLEEEAVLLKRGSISGVGTAAYLHGGFIVDAGISLKDRGFPKIVFNKPMYEDWVFVVVVPETKNKVSGRVEDEAFRKIMPGQKEIAGEISRTVVMKLLPAYIEKDIKSFGEAVTEIDRKTAEYYKKLPKNPLQEKIIDGLIECGAYGAGQSSWGPTVYGLTEKKRAEHLIEDVKDFLHDLDVKAEAFTAEPDNRGAVIEKQFLT